MKLCDGIFMVGSGEFGLSNNYDCSVYIIDAGENLFMIDCGSGVNAERIVQNMKDDGLEVNKLKALFLTHCHLDHAGGAHYFEKEHGVDIFIAVEEMGLLLSGTEQEIGLESAKDYGIYGNDVSFTNCRKAIPIEDGNEYNLGALSLRAISVPGHSLGSMCFRVTGNNLDALFTGDTTFANGVIGLLNLEGSSLKGFRDFLPKLENEVAESFLPGHGVFSLSRGHEHILQALQAVRSIAVPKSIL